MSTCKTLHELRGYRYLADSYRVAGQFGIAIGLLRYGLSNAQKKPPEMHVWASVFKADVSKVSELQKKYEEENNFLSREKVPLEHELPPPEHKKIVSFTPYLPQASPMGRELCFNLNL